MTQKATEVVGALAKVEQLLGPVEDRSTEDLEVLALIDKHGLVERWWRGGSEHNNYALVDLRINYYMRHLSIIISCVFGSKNLLSIHVL